MATAAEYGEALVAAHKAGNREHAAVLARAYEDAKAKEAAAPAEKPGFVDQMREGLAGSLVTSRAMAQGIPGVGGWTDELYGKLRSMIDGGDAEQHRRDYMAPVEAMPAGRRTAAELVGGVAGGIGLAAALPATVASVPAALATGTFLGAVEGAGRNQDDRAAGALLGTGVGLVGGAAGLAGGHAIAKYGHPVANFLRRIAGKAENPFTGTAGNAARETLLESAERMGNRNPGEGVWTAEAPLGLQRAAAPAAMTVAHGGGKPADRLGAAGAEWMAQGQGQLDDVAKDVARRGSLMATEGRNAQDVAERVIGLRGEKLTKQGDDILYGAEKALRDRATVLADEGQGKVASAAGALASTGKDVGKQGVRNAGRGYQDLGITPVGVDSTVEDVVQGATLKTARLDALIDGSEDIQRVLAEQGKDLLWQNVPANNVNRLHDIRTSLAHRARAANNAADPDRALAGRLSRLSKEMADAIDEALPGYKDVAANYRQTIGLKNARDLGYGFDSRKITREALDEIPPDERAEAIAGMAERFRELISPVGGDALPPNTLNSTIARLKKRMAPVFGGDSKAVDAFVATVREGSEQIKASQIAARAAKPALASADPRRLGDELAPAFPQKETLDAFLKTIGAGQKKVALGKQATSMAGGRIGTDDTMRLRDQMLDIFEGNSAAADSMVKMLTDAATNQRAGKSAMDLATKGITTTKGLDKAIKPLFGDETATVMAAVEKAISKVNAGMAAGGMSDVPVLEAKKSILRWVHNLVSGSLTGAATRGGIGGVAAITDKMVRRTEGEAAKRIVDVLTEMDPKKIEAILKFMNTDTTGRPLRPLTVFNGPNALAAWQREEQQ